MQSQRERGDAPILLLVALGVGAILLIPLLLSIGTPSTDNTPTSYPASEPTIPEHSDSYTPQPSLPSVVVQNQTAKQNKIMQKWHLMPYQVLVALIGSPRDVGRYKVGGQTMYTWYPPGAPNLMGGLWGLTAGVWDDGTIGTVIPRGTMPEALLDELAQGPPAELLLAYYQSHH